MITTTFVPQLARKHIGMLFTTSSLSRKIIKGCRREYSISITERNIHEAVDLVTLNLPEISTCERCDETLKFTQCIVPWVRYVVFQVLVQCI